ncbi:MAG: TldD/PmbA family protein [Candidatus Desulfofervidaceae bacterium]|nr:TldD/PmbA family protein [Candidatus Desulfofervidaceae bacterium]
MKTIIKACKDKIAVTGIENFEIYAIRTKSTIIQVKNGKVEFLNIAESKGLSLRIITEGRLGFSYTTDFRESALDQIVAQAKAGGLATSSDPFLCFPPPIHDYPQVSIYDQAAEKINLAAKIEFAKEMESAAKNYAPCIKRVRQSQFQDVVAEVYLHNHHGLDIAYQRTLYSGSILVMAEEKEEGEMGWNYAFHPYFHKLNPQEIGKEAAEIAAGMLGAKPIPTQKTNVIFINRVMSEILDVLSVAFRADEVQKGKSLLASYLDKTVMSPQVTIYDDGLYTDGYATRPFDDEGVPQQTTLLVENGVLKGFLYDTYTAAKEGKSSTGNAGRLGLETPPQVSLTNLYLAPGAISFSELLKTLHTGLVVTDVLGMHTADPISGDFSVGASGYWVERGERNFPVKGIAVAGNVLELFKNILAVGQDLRFFGHCGAPSVLIKGIQVSGY